MTLTRRHAALAVALMMAFSFGYAMGALDRHSYGWVVASAAGFLVALTIYIMACIKESQSQ